MPPDVYGLYYRQDDESSWKLYRVYETYKEAVDAVAFSWEDFFRDLRHTVVRLTPSPV